MFKVKFDVYNDELFDDEFFNNLNVVEISQDYDSTTYEVTLENRVQVLELLTLMQSFDEYSFTNNNKLLFKNNEDEDWFDSSFEMSEMWLKLFLLNKYYFINV